MSMVRKNSEEEDIKTMFSITLFYISFYAQTEKFAVCHLIHRIVILAEMRPKDPTLSCMFFFQ